MNCISVSRRLFKGLISILFFAWANLATAQDPYVATQAQASYVTLSASGKSTPIYVDETDYPGVIRAAKDLQGDMKAVTDHEPVLLFTSSPTESEIVIAGTIGKNALIDQLIQNGKLDVSDIKEKWETSVTQTIDLPFPAVKKAIVIAGSDKRGTIFGIYELSRQIGVSPWYWWADVSVKKSNDLFMKPGRYVQGEPAVKYRGIFLNDEQPALGGWVAQNYGGFNSKFYTKLFELILRLKGNFLWPAMWGQSFYTEDPLNATLADEYGVVISTSHHEPMMRAHVEWERSKGGAWNYATNDSTLRTFWREGIRRIGNNESIVTLAMRGDGDAPMSQESNVALLQRIVSDQRKIIREVTGKNITAVPQVWALYKEVQDYYDKGMRVPDDVTLLLCDDNWGNIRKLPKPDEPTRAGGYGIYYHFDYVGGPRNYKWINTNPIERVWEQMHMAYEHGVDRIWVVNVGDLKPMELPISFFLDYAWNPDAIKADQLQAYTERWSEQQFGAANATEIASLLSAYTKFNGRVKPELLNEKTYSLDNYGEFGRVVNDYRQLAARALTLQKKIESSQQDAYDQLVLHPILASANLYDMYYQLAMNQQAVSNHDPAANQYADRVKELYKKDSLITRDYHQLNHGKWNHMMDQTHIGYTTWQQPDVNKMPAVSYVTSGVRVKPAAAPVPRDAKSLIPKTQTGNVFYEKDGYVSIHADHITKSFSPKEISWQVLPNHGRTGSAITPFPATAKTQALSSSSPHLDYDFYTYGQGDATLQLFFSPTLNVYHSPAGLQYAISVDDEKPQVVSLNADDAELKTWEGWVAHNIIIRISPHRIISAGKHTIRFWMIDPGVVLQKLVFDLGGVKPSYLGPPETRFGNQSNK